MSDKLDVKGEINHILSEIKLLKEKAGDDFTPTVYFMQSVYKLGNNTLFQKILNELKELKKLTEEKNININVRQISDYRKDN